MSEPRNPRQYWADEVKKLEIYLLKLEIYLLYSPKTRNLLIKTRFTDYYFIDIIDCVKSSFL